MKRKIIIVIIMGSIIQLFTLFFGWNAFKISLRVVPLLIFVGIGLLFITRKEDIDATDTGMLKLIRKAKLTKEKSELRRLFISDKGENKILRGHITGYLPIEQVEKVLKRVKVKEGKNKGKFVHRWIPELKTYSLFIIKGGELKEEMLYLIESKDHSELKGDVILQEHNFMLVDNIYIPSKFTLPVEKGVNISQVNASKPNVIERLGSMVDNAVELDSWHKKRIAFEKSLEIPEGVKFEESENVPEPETKEVNNKNEPKK